MGEEFKSTIKVGMVLDDKWVVLQFIGKGGMGEVYRAHQLNLKRDVAIKIVSEDYLRSFDCDAEEIESSLERFHREVQVMAQVHHPNVLQVFDYGVTTIRKGDQETSFEYIAMEYVPGSTLRTTMSDEGFSPEEERMRQWLSDYFLPTLDGIKALHERGIIHRDLKPENILLAGKAPKITDFGLARSCMEKPITQSAQMMGTPQYMAPEQFMDMKRTDERADIYSLGKMLYEAASGKIRPDLIPFRQASLQDAEGEFYQHLSQIIQRVTAEDKRERYPSVDDLRQAIELLLDPPYGATIKPSSTSIKGKAAGSAFRSNPWTLRAALALVLGTIAVVLFLSLQKGVQTPDHHGITPSSKSSMQPEVKSAPPAAPIRPPPETQAKTRMAKDGAVLHLVPAGMMTIPGNWGAEAKREVQVKAFYMDETQVTNHQYVDFLNNNLSRITVSDGVVRGDGEVWLFLGEVFRGYEPIVYRENKFHVNLAHHAACPVLRVTANGASAYAAYYGKRLPTVAQWLRAVTDEESAQKGDQISRFPDKRLPVPTPVMEYKPNALGIQGLNANIGEWGLALSEDGAATEKAPVAYKILGAVPDEAVAIPPPLTRQPWEASQNVGFRTVEEVIPPEE